MALSKLVQLQPYTGPTSYGTIPKRTSCVANANGYGPHETDGEISLDRSNTDDGVQLCLCFCKHCGSTFVKGFK